MPSYGVRLSVSLVCLSVCPSRSYIRSKRINIPSNFFHLTVGQPHHCRPSFSTPNVMAIFRRGPPDGGVECWWRRQKPRFPTSVWLYRLLPTLRPARCYQHGAAGPWQVVTLIAGGKWRSLLLAGNDDEMFMTRRQQNGI